MKQHEYEEERIAKLRDEYIVKKEIQYKIERALSYIEKLESENSRLREALSWYADESNYDLPTIRATPMYDEIKVREDNGQRAREALNGN